MMQSINDEMEIEVKKSSVMRTIAMFLFDFFEMAGIAVAVVFVLFTCFFRLNQVDGASMNNTLQDQEKLLTINKANVEQDDIVIFHVTSDSMQKMLVKRVIATGGQKLEIDFYNNIITVDGVVYEDSHSILNESSSDNRLYPSYGFDASTGIFSVTVPEGYVFVMGDNRNNSHDSRASDIGFVDERSIIGVAVLRLSPFTIFD